jgi:NDP-sugar pyrophosphorylase family protein
MNAGIYHLDRRILADLPARGSIEEITFHKYAQKRKIFGIKFRGVFWYSIDSHKDLEDCANATKVKKYEKFVSK